MDDDDQIGVTRGEPLSKRTCQSERKENTQYQKHSRHHRATEKASTGSSPAPSGPQILMSLSSPAPETFLPASSVNDR